MIIVHVTYTVKPTFTEQNQNNIRKVMEELRQHTNSGINYHACLGADGKTFMHHAFFRSEEDRKLLNELPAFKRFQEELKASGPEAPPKQEMLSFIGSSKEIF
jgi:hypothetical protein